MTVNKLISHLGAYIPLKEVEKQDLLQRAVERKIKRRQFILQKGDNCKHYTFVISGCFKMFGLDNNETEHNLQFAAENDWIVDIGSFHSNKASQLYIEALEPSIILQIEKHDLIYLYHNHPKFDRIFRVMIENKFIELQNRVLQAMGSTAEERYTAFLQQYPTLANRLPNTQIASYIGITPEFLSKIRKALSHK